MAYLVARMRKFKRENLIGIGNHNQRRAENHRNKDIDKDKTMFNYDLVGKAKDFKKDVESYIERNKSGKRAVRKDAVLVSEWIIGSSANFFEEKSDTEIRRYFEVAVKFFCEKFGEDNVRYGIVHMDEKTPHMHLGVVPFDKDKKLSAKRVFDRKTLVEIQDELPWFLRSHGFDIQRGERGSEAVHLHPDKYKATQDRNRNIELQRKRERELLESVSEVKRELTFFDNQLRDYQFVIADVLSLKERSEGIFGKSLKNADLDKLFLMVESKSKENKELRTELNSLKKELIGNKERIQELKKELGKNKKLLAKREWKIELYEREVKRYDRDFMLIESVLRDVNIDFGKVYDRVSKMDELEKNARLSHYKYMKGVLPKNSFAYNKAKDDMVRFIKREGGKETNIIKRMKVAIKDIVAELKKWYEQGRAFIIDRERD